MFNNFVDALQICNWIGFPSLFITITCNPQWPEIQRALSGTNLRTDDRPDILARVFKMKLDSLMSDLKKGKIFGRIRAYVCTIEFQKRGLPHAHILIWLHNEDKPKTSKDIDKIICAEIPDKVTDQKMYDLVEKYMIHGPCGLANENSPCTKDGICTKRFPKSFVNRTEADADGYPVYRRRENGRTVVKKKTYLDNGFVVPYNRALLKKYRAHIIVELCNQNKSIKYLFKYVNKGHDRITAAFYQSNNPGATPKNRDEIKMYYDCGYLSACEAAWRLFSFDIHFRDPPVIRLSFHLQDSQSVVFTDNDSLVDVLNRPTAKQTMFLAWFQANKLYPKARNLRGCTCYDDLRKVEDHIYPTFKDACFALGLLDDDKEYIAGIKEANEWANGDYVRRLFVVLLVANNMSRLEHVWECYWKEFAEDIEYRLQQRRTNLGPSVSDDTLRNYALIEIENILQNNSKSLSNFPPMPIPIGSMTNNTVNRLVLDELDYDVDAMREELKKYLSSITDEQKKVFDDIMDAVTNDRGGLFFLYGHGRTGKTFIWKTLSAVIRSKGEIVINVASSGIASLLLPGGRTAHSRFGLPIIVHESSTCSIKQQSLQAELLSRAKLIIWDEAPMMHMYCFEALDKTMKSILDSYMPFGGKVVVLGGGLSTNFASCVESVETRHCACYNQFITVVDAMQDEIREFADWILRIGNGDAGEINDGDATIEIPDDMLIRNSADPFLDLIEFVYPDLVTNLFTPEYFEGRSILAPTNESVGFVNDYFLSIITGEEKVYFSSDSMCKEELLSDVNAEIYSPEFLNTISCSRIPPHKLTLKRGVPVMLIRNIDQARGLCNGTRLQIINMGKHVLNCRILSGKHVGDMVFIPIMTLVPSNSALPIKFQRRQFPLMVSFAMTINKSQGQTLSHVGMYLPRPVFSHGHLYIALSRVKSRSGINILINSKSGDTTNVTNNVVYKEVF
ncbi:PREDICTED: uncharacterized protein LOC105957872 [Erythranthe guttata]|uniref:uncharacterized protein LOC105957872 n=1 Tax=Erythranthe guttata TaxID=4155 RepID=UPI00064D7DE6|nr:PREDICTED: uncharacterized protein LOC105957872 [Erythranthe guttata]|eukprot:XP_012837300.1 PREDICTED: uncharacterized protein LOC105957872 [Erythranthe guttata]